jgi:hypothetical protein
MNPQMSETFQVQLWYVLHYARGKNSWNSGNKKGLESTFRSLVS